MMSDSAVSGQADKAWQHLASHPGVSVKFGTPGTGEAHVATMVKVELPGNPGQPGEPRPPQGPDPQKKAPSAGAKKFQPVVKREFKLKDARSPLEVRGLRIPSLHGDPLHVVFLSPVSV